MHHTDSPTPPLWVGVHDSRQSQAAVRWAAAHAAMTGTELDIVHVWGLEPSDMYGPTGDLRDAVLPDLRKRLVDMVTDAIGPAGGPTPWTLEIIQGPPGPTLVQRANDADLLVVGTGEHAGVRRLVSGSVSHHCLSHAHGPVVAVPALAEPAAETDARVPESVPGRPS